MVKSIKERWIEALRSGKYTQGEGMLKTSDGPDAKFCCLGVLADIQRCQWENEFPIRYDFDGYNDYTTRETSDLGPYYRQPSHITREFLAESNDGGIAGLHRGLKTATFAEIADWIEEHLDDNLQGGLDGLE